MIFSLFIKKRLEESQAFDKLSKAAFACERDAQNAFDKFSSKCKYLTVSGLEIKRLPYFNKKGRPKKGEVPAGYQYFITANAYGVA